MYVPSTRSPACRGRATSAERCTTAPLPGILVARGVIGACLVQFPIPCHRSAAEINPDPKRTSRQESHPSNGDPTLTRVAPNLRREFRIGVKPDPSRKYNGGASWIGTRPHGMASQSALDQSTRRTAPWLPEVTILE